MAVDAVPRARTSSRCGVAGWYWMPVFQETNRAAYRASGRGRTELAAGEPEAPVALGDLRLLPAEVNREARAE
jgi:hypothetical protein